MAEHKAACLTLVLMSLGKDAEDAVATGRQTTQDLHTRPRRITNPSRRIWKVVR